MAGSWLYHVVVVNEEIPKEVWGTQIRKGLADLAVLTLLARESTYGSDLVSRLAAHPALAMASGTVYPLLNRLKAAGLLSTRWQESPLGPPRKYYSLTPEGNRALEAMRASWKDVVTDLTNILEES